MESNRELRIPGTNQVIRPGYKIKLGRFENTVWIVGFGWYSNGGNRPCCGWYLTSEYDRVTKPLHMTDLDDVYLVDMCPTEHDFGRSVEEIDREVLNARLGADGILYATLGESIRNQILNVSEECRSVVVLRDIKHAPIHGKRNTLYVDLSEKMLYVWHKHEYECISTSGDEVTSSDKNGYIQVNGEDVQVYCPPQIDDEVSPTSKNAVQNKAIHSYVNNEVVAINKELCDIKNRLAHGIFYEIID